MTSEIRMGYESRISVYEVQFTHSIVVHHNIVSVPL
jgi:hypothetical protein